MSESTATPSVSRIGDGTQDGALVGAARVVESTARRMKEKVAETKDRLAQKPLGEWVEDGREVVRENPVKTVLICVGVGALIGYAIGRRRA